METFGVLLIAVDDYPDPPGRLPSSESAKRLSAIVIGDRGGTLIESIVATSQEDIISAFERWGALDAHRPLSTLVYLVGHGTDDGLDHSFIVPGPGPRGIRELRTSEFAKFFQLDWFRRQANAEVRGWTLFVLDCCGSDIGVTNLVHALTAIPIKRPNRLALWPVTPRGASHSGAFVDAFDRAVATFTENDSAIPLNEVFERMRPELGDLEPDRPLPPEAVLANPLRTSTPLVMNLDAHTELRRVIGRLPDDVRNHFLTKAQGAEAGDLEWYFSGRDSEIRDLSTWLHESPTGMRVVTGEAGSGKSALLGQLLVLSDDVLTHTYAKSGLAPGLATHIRPPSDVFDATLHLTGRTLAQTFRELRRQMSARGLAVPDAATADEWLRELKAAQRPLTILADALDEAQEPMPIAEFLRQAVAHDSARVVIGTRRSLSEGPDHPTDRTRHELIDALAARSSDLVVIGRDRAAMREYVIRRLSAAASRYSGHHAAIEALADQIAATDQPMLFARLITSELLARPTLSPDDPAFARLLKGSHRDVFAAAVERLVADDPATVVMLRALALGRGRGVPETGGTWLAMARGLVDGNVPDTAVRTTIEHAAPYVMLDAEAGQSVYRLAHRTFVEYFGAEASAGVEHRKAAIALQALVQQKGGWVIANFYLVRYLPEHFTAELDRTPPDKDGLAALATDPDWLSRAMALLGVDEVVDTLASARGALDIPLAETIERVLRRSRIALSRDLTQLAGQVHARLHTAKEPQLATLGERLASHTDAPWLRLHNGALEWQADLETTYTQPGSVGGLAFGQVDGQPLVAIGIDHVIRLWDPRRGLGSDRVLENDKWITSLALSHLNGRPVVVAASALPDDRTAVIRDLHSGAQIGPALFISAHTGSIALGTLGERMAVAAKANFQGFNLFVWDARTGEGLSDFPDRLRGWSFLSVAQFDERLVAFTVRDGGTDVWVVDIASGEDLWPTPQHLPRLPNLISATGTHDNFVAVAFFVHTHHSGPDSILIWSPAHPSPPGTPPSVENIPPMPIRTGVVGQAAGKSFVAFAADYPSTALVAIRLSSTEDKREETLLAAKRLEAILRDERVEAVFARNDGDHDNVAVKRVVLLTDRPLAVAPPFSDEPVDTAPKAATVSFALTGISRPDLRFTRDAATALTTPPPKRRDLSASSYHPDEPSEWPRFAHCYGLVSDRPVMAICSLAGAIWIWDLATNALVAGPLKLGIEEAIKWPTSRYRSSVALGHSPKGDIIAVAYDGALRTLTVPDGEEVPTPAADATVVISVALGRLLGEDVLVTGSQGGVIVIWGLMSNARVAALTIDSPVERVWVVRGADAIAVQITDKGKPALLVMDVLSKM